MNTCLYEPIHGSYPECDGKCKTGPDKHCPYYFIDEVWETMNKWKIEAHVNTPIIWKTDKKTMYIYTKQPGSLIGCRGALIEKYRNLLDEAGIKTRIELVECEDCVS